MLRKITFAVLIILILIWVLFPFYSLIVTSVTPVGGIGKLIPDKVTFKFFEQVLFGIGSTSGKTIWPYMLNSIIICLVVTVIVLVFCLPCSYSLSRMKTRTSGAIYLGYYVLRTLPPIAIVIPVFFIITKLKLMDNLTSLILVNILFQIPVGVWLMKGFFDTIPVEIEESAFIDGASVPQTFLKIILPLASNGMSVTATFIFLFTYMEFMYANILTRTDSAVTIPIYISSFATIWEIKYQQMLVAALVGMIPMIIVFIIVQRYLVKSIISGSIKA